LVNLKGTEIWVVRGVVNSQECLSFKQNPSFLWEHVIQLSYKNKKDTTKGKLPIVLIGALTQGTWLDRKELYNYYNISCVKEQQASYFANSNLARGVKELSSGESSSYEPFKRKEQFFPILRLLEKVSEESS
jgi:hypothetical protein